VNKISVRHDDNLTPNANYTKRFKARRTKSEIRKKPENRIPDGCRR
jgi:hypothetical protein